MLRDKWNGCKMDSLGIWQIWSREDESRSIGENWFSRHQEDQGPSYLDPWKGILDLLSHPHIHASCTGRGIRRSETVGYSKLSIFRRGRRDVELSQARNRTGCIGLGKAGKGWHFQQKPLKEGDEQDKKAARRWMLSICARKERSNWVTRRQEHHYLDVFP